jgi:hypothetical protein
MKIISRILAGLCVLALGFTLAGSVSTANAAPVTKAAVVAPVPGVAGDVKIIEYGPNAPGADTAAKRNYEFLRLANVTVNSIDVEGWWVQDNYPHVYKLQASKLPATSPFRDAGPDTTMNTADDRFVIPVGGQVYVYNGSGVDGNPTNLTAALYRDYIHHFNNAGDTLRVKTAAGVTSHWITYTPYRVRIG